MGLGFDAELYYRAVPELNLALNTYINYEGVQLKVVQNDNPQQGAFSTLKRVLKTLEKADDALICPIDIPVLEASELKKIINTKAQIVKPIYRGESGHPIKISSKFVEHVLNQPISSRLDTIISKTSNKELIKVMCNDKQLVMNLNSLKDWNNYKDNIPLSQKYLSHEN